MNIFIGFHTIFDRLIFKNLKKLNFFDQNI